MMSTDILESTRLSDMDVDEICQGILTTQDMISADKIDDLSIMENIINDDFVQQMNLSLLNSSIDLSFEDRLEENLNLANKNKIIQEQENKITRLDKLVEGLMSDEPNSKVQVARKKIKT